LHHSADPAHFNCNMGASLAIWDWLAGSLRMPSLEPPRRLPAAPSRPRSLPLLPLVIALIAVGIAASAAIGHPVPPPFILAALIWRFGLRRRRWTTL